MIWVVILAAILAAPFVIEALRPRITATERKAAPGRFAQLSQGVTHYDWLGPARGPVAVCVHGLSTPSFVWQGVARGLAGMGFRVLIYDLYGRGWSDRPRGRQDAAFFIRQFEDLMSDQGIEDDITLLGYSMGGSIATAFAAHAPERLRRLILIAPGGMAHSLGRAARFMRDVPLLGDWLMLAAYPRAHRRGTEAERNVPSAVDGIVDMQQAELRWRGFLPAILSSLRGMLARPLEAEHRDIAGTDMPVVAIWGRDDAVIPLSAMGKLAEWNRHARQEVIDGAGHGLPHTHSVEVIAAIRDATEV